MGQRVSPARSRQECRHGHHAIFTGPTAAYYMFWQVCGLGSVQPPRDIIGPRQLYVAARLRVTYNGQQAAFQCGAGGDPAHTSTSAASRYASATAA
jgi:hypothetical protein